MYMAELLLVRCFHSITNSHMHMWRVNFYYIFIFNWNSRLLKHLECTFMCRSYDDKRLLKFYAEFIILVQYRKVNDSTDDGTKRNSWRLKILCMLESTTANL